MNIKFENRFEKSITQQQASDSVIPPYLLFQL